MIILDNFFLLSPLHDFHVYTLDADEQLRMHNMKILFSFIHKHMFFFVGVCDARTSDVGYERVKQNLTKESQMSRARESRIMGEGSCADHKGTKLVMWVFLCFLILCWFIPPSFSMDSFASIVKHKKVSIKLWFTTYHQANYCSLGEALSVTSGRKHRADLLILCFSPWSENNQTFIITMLPQ